MSFKVLCYSIILLSIFYFLFSTPIYAALPTLEYFTSLIPGPVVTFYEGIANTDFSFHEAFRNLPENRADVVNFFKAIGSILLTLLKGAGSIFTWIFNGIANGLQYLITTP